METRLNEHQNLITARTLFNVAAIISIIIGILLSLTLVGIIFGVLYIIGGVQLLKYKNMSLKELEDNNQNILTWGLVYLIVSVVAGVAILIAYVLINCTDFEGAKSKSTESSRFSELEKAYELMQNGIISEEEYVEIKNSIIF